MSLFFFSALAALATSPFRSQCASADDHGWPRFHSVEELEQDFAKRLEVERRRIEQLAVEELRVRETVRHIQERILTLKCPRAGCEAAFVDFNGCFALTCHRCHCGFCAYCLQDCGQLASQREIQENMHFKAVNLPF